jgi:heptosyltransferase-2
MKMASAINWQDPTDLIWLQTGFLGDIVLTTAAIRLGRQLFPGARHYLITTPVGAEALGSWSGLDQIISWNKREGIVAAFQEIKARFTGLVGARPVLLRPHGSIRSALLGQYLGWPVISHREGHLSVLSMQRVTRVAVLHEAQRVAMLLESLGARREDIARAMPTLDPQPQPSAAWAAAIDALPEFKIGIAPGSVWATKRWLPEGFRDLVGMILEQTDAGIVMLGGRDEASLVDEIIAPYRGHQRLVNTAGQTKIRDMLWLVPRLGQIVANDSAPVHFATAFGVPTLAIFGATLPEMGFAPLAPGSVTVGLEQLSCRPCGAHGHHVCPQGHFRCMRDLSSATIMASLLRMRRKAEGESLRPQE